MEDQKRGMEGNQQITASLKENSPGSDEITIMIMGNVGRIRSFTISRRILLWASVFLLIYILLSLFVIIRFINVSSRYGALSERLKDINEKYDRMEKDFLEAKQHAANLDAYLGTREQKEKSSTIQRAVEAVPAGDKPTAVVSEKGNEIKQESVDIEGLNIRRSDKGVVIDFKLVNMNLEETPVEGYVHIIVSNKNNNFPETWNEPSKEIRNGQPSDYRSGEHFTIQRFKQFHREFMSNSVSGTPSSISIQAYNPSGELILKKVYDVNNL